MVLYYAVMQERGEDAGRWTVVGVESKSLDVALCGKAFEGGAEVAIRGAGGRLEGTFGDGVGVEGNLYRGGRGCGEDPGLYGVALDLVQGEARAVDDLVAWFRDGIQMAGSYAGLQDQIPVRLRDAVAVVDDGQGSVAPVSQGRGDVDVGRPRVAGVARQLQEGVFHVGNAGRTAAGPFHAGQAGEARAEGPLGGFPYRFSCIGCTIHVAAILAWAVREPPLQGTVRRKVPYLATSLTRLSRMTVTFIWPGYSRSVSICLEIS